MQKYFEKGDEEAIQRAKKLYRTVYKREWKRKKRATIHSITIPFSSKEYMQIQHEAKRHTSSKTKFIHDAVFAYLNRRYIVIDQMVLKEILKLLVMIHAESETRYEDNLLRKEEFTRVVSQLDIIERMIRIAVVSPYTIEQAIKKEIEKNREYALTLLTYLNSIR